MTQHGGPIMTLRECMEAEESPSQPVAATRRQPLQMEMRECPYCKVMFQPKRPRQGFCKRQCGKWYHEDVGTEGVVAGVTRIKRGVSIVLHFANGPAAERAVMLLKGEIVRAITKP